MKYVKNAILFIMFCLYVAFLLQSMKSSKDSYDNKYFSMITERLHANFSF